MMHRRKEMFYLMMRSTHFIYGYIALDDTWWQQYFEWCFVYNVLPTAYLNAYQFFQKDCVAGPSYINVCYIL